MVRQIYFNKVENIPNISDLIHVKFIIVGYDKKEDTLFLTNRDDKFNIINLGITPIPEHFFNNDDISYIFDQSTVITISNTEFGDDKMKGNNIIYSSSITDDKLLELNKNS